MAETTRAKTHVEIQELLDSYFRYTLRLDLDEDVPACATDLATLCDRRVAEALDEAAGRLHAQVAEQRGTTWDSLRHAADVVTELAAEYRAGAR